MREPGSVWMKLKNYINLQEISDEAFVNFLTLFAPALSVVALSVVALSMVTLSCFPQRANLNNLTIGDEKDLAARAFLSILQDKDLEAAKILKSYERIILAEGFLADSVSSRAAEVGLDVEIMELEEIRERHEAEGSFLFVRLECCQIENVDHARALMDTIWSGPGSGHHTRWSFVVRYERRGDEWMESDISVIVADTAALSASRWRRDEPLLATLLKPPPSVISEMQQMGAQVGVRVRFFWLLPF